MIDENLVLSCFPPRVYNGINDLAETIMNPANCRSSTVILHTKENLKFTQPEPVYVYTNIIKPNFVGDTYVQLLTSLHFPSDKGYHRFDYPFYKPVEQFFIEFISIRALWYYTLKRSPHRNKSQFVSYNASIYTLLRKSKCWWRNCSCVQA